MKGKRKQGFRPAIARHRIDEKGENDRKSNGGVRGVRKTGGEMKKPFQAAR